MGPLRFLLYVCGTSFGHLIRLAAQDAGELFVDDFVAAWNKVMMLDRFDMK